MELVTGHAGTLHITAKQVSRLLRGVTATDESTVQRLNVGNNAAITYSGITMSIASGELLLDGYHVTLVDDTGGASGETLIFDATLESTNSRIDKVVLEIVQDNTTSYQRAEIVIVQGEESASPVAPATPTEPESSTEQFLAVGVIAQVTITGDDISSLSDLTNLYGGNYVEYTKFEDTISDLVNVYGAKNLIPYDYLTASQVVNGITVTPLGDGTYKLNGTATSYADIRLSPFGTSSYDACLTLEKGVYILSGTTISSGSGGSGKSNVGLVKNDGTSRSNLGFDLGDGFTFTHSDTSIRYEAKISVPQGITLSDVVFKPMLRMASIDDDTYEPYAMTNQELTKNVQDIESDISETQDIISDAWSSSKTYAADEYCISGNKLYKCLVANTGTQPPNATYWEETTCAEELSELNSNLTDMHNSVGSGFVNSDVVAIWRNAYGNNLVGKTVETKGTYFILLKVCTDFPTNVPEDVYLVINMRLNGSEANFANAVNDSISSDTYNSNMQCGGPGRINHLVYEGFCKLEANDSITAYVSYSNSTYQLRILSPQLILIRVA